MWVVNNKKLGTLPFRGVAICVGVPQGEFSKAKSEEMFETGKRRTWGPIAIFINERWHRVIMRISGRPVLFVLAWEDCCYFPCDACHLAKDMGWLSKSWKSRMIEYS